MTEMMMNNMVLTNEALESVNGGAVVKAKVLGKRRTASLATLRQGPHQKSAKIMMLPAGTVVNVTNLVRKDVTYRYRYVVVVSTGKRGWVADSLLR